MALKLSRRSNAIADMNGKREIGDEGKLLRLSVDTLVDHPDEAYLYGEDRQTDVIKKSIEESGCIGSIVVSHRTNKYIILSGHTRVQACRELGIKEIQCQVYENLTEEAEKRLLVDLNGSRYREANNYIARAKELDYRYNQYVTECASKNEVATRVELFAKERFGYSKTMTYRLMNLLKMEPEVQVMIENDELPAYAMDGAQKLDRETQIELANKIKNGEDERDKKEKAKRTKNKKVIPTVENAFDDDEDDDDIKINMNNEEVTDQDIINAITHVYSLAAKISTYENEQRIKEELDRLIVWANDEKDALTI